MELEKTPPEREPRSSDRRRRGRGRRILLWLMGLVVAVALFAAGVAVGRALEDKPRPGGLQTLVRTLQPATVKPLEGTVTVTVSSP